jgi:hypothetical protein
MMQTDHTSPLPLGWLQTFAINLAWPVVVLGAFWIGRFVQRLEMRVSKAETDMKSLMERHLPAIHNALSELLGLMRGRR